MFEKIPAFSSFSVADLQETKAFYGETLGLKITEENMNTLALHLAGGHRIVIYSKGEDHQSASFTILNFSVADIEEAVEQLTQRGVKIIQYDGDLKTNARGIHQKNNISIAWFKDPSENILSAIQEQ